MCMFLLALTFTAIQLDTLSVPAPVGVATTYATPIPAPTYQTYVPPAASTTPQQTAAPLLSQPSLPQGTVPNSTNTLSAEDLLREMQQSQTDTSLVQGVYELTGRGSTAATIDRVLLHTPTIAQSLDMTLAQIGSSLQSVQYPESLRERCDTTNKNVFSVNARRGDIALTVRHIQQFLNSSPQTMLAESGAGSVGNETETFADKTYVAVKKFQTRYASEILAPLGLTEATGEWGASTRKKANKLLCN